MSLRYFDFNESRNPAPRFDTLSSAAKALLSTTTSHCATHGPPQRHPDPAPGLPVRAWGCECEVVESLEDALTLVGRWVPEVVITDYRLRNQGTGVEVIEALRARLGQELPALLITGDTAPQRLREAVTTGLPLLHKPESPSRLYRELVTGIP